MNDFAPDALMAGPDRSRRLRLLAPSSRVPRRTRQLHRCAASHCVRYRARIPRVYIYNPLNLALNLIPYATRYHTLPAASIPSVYGALAVNEPLYVGYL